MAQPLVSWQCTTCGEHGLARPEFGGVPAHHASLSPYCSGIPMETRAATPGQKDEIIRRLAALWERSPQLRLGQLIHVGIASHQHGNSEEIAVAVADRLFSMEDYTLISAIEEGLQ